MTLLITPQEVFNRTQLDNNIDASELKPYIEDMHTEYLNSLLGDTLARKIKADYTADSLANSYLEVFEIMKLILIYASAGEYCLFAQYKVSNGGIFKLTSQRGEIVSSSEVEALSKRYKSKAQVYISELERYICSNIANLPEYSTQENNWDKRPSRGRSQNSGWTF